MKTRFYSILCAALVLGTVSCSKEVSPVVEEKPAVVSLTAGFDDVKTTVANDGKVAWAEGDQLWVKCGSETAIFTLDPADAGKNVGKFTTTSVMDFQVGSSLEAYYPAEVGNNGSPVWPAEQTYSENMGCPMHATATIATEGTAPQLSFKNLGSILRLSIGTSQAGKKVKSIIVSSTTPLAGAFSVDADGKAIISGTQTDITLDCGEEGIEIGTTPKTINVAIPANATSEAKYKDFYVTVTSTDNTFAESTMKDLSTSFKRNTVYNNSTFTAAAFTEAPSNCYIVAPGTTKTISAQHMGHSLKSADHLIGVAGAELLWETVNTTEAPAQNSIITDLSYANGYITFTTGSIPGNAYIVAKDSEGNTVWGWHIWVVEGGVVPTITSEDGKVTMLSYDMGALEEGGYALEYQGERHCPVVAVCGTWNDPVRMASTPPASTIDVKGKTALNYTTDRYGINSALADMISLSGRMIKIEVGDGLDYMYDKTDKHSLWTRNDPWSYKGKSIYDPCPDGYRIPTSGEYKTLIGSTPTLENDVYTYSNGWKFRHTAFVGSSNFFKSSVSTNGYGAVTTKSGCASHEVCGPHYNTRTWKIGDFNSTSARPLRCIKY